MSKLPLEKIINRYNELSKKMAQTSDTKELIELSKEQNKFMNQYEIALRISDLERNIEENNQLIKELSEDDIEMVELTKLDNEEKSAELEQKVDEYTFDDAASPAAAAPEGP
ncbi:MAG: hypothetical protein HC932_03700, partial [Thermales bacterium]|nr:hypothetical protein [Thermales bacterium]